MEMLQYDPPMATKLVVLQSCGVALEVEPCSVSDKIFHWEDVLHATTSRMGIGANCRYIVAMILTLPLSYRTHFGIVLGF